jgi:multicomponent Na+:H+ antiporter subunit B
MRDSLFLKTSLKFLVPVLLLISILVMWRGHQLPGGGFVGGLIASAALVLRAIAFSKTDGLSLGTLKFSSMPLISLGLAVSAGSTLIAPLKGESLMKGIWFEVPVLGTIGTPVIFDMGVYLTVLGVVCSILLPLLNDDSDPSKSEDSL